MDGINGGVVAINPQLKNKVCIPNNVDNHHHDHSSEDEHSKGSINSNINEIKIKKLIEDNTKDNKRERVKIINEGYETFYKKGFKTPLENFDINNIEVEQKVNQDTHGAQKSSSGHIKKE